LYCIFKVRLIKRGFLSLPFEKFIISLLLCNKDVPFIKDKLNTFGYFATDAMIGDVFRELKAILPESISEMVKAKQLLSLQNNTHAQWLKTLGVYEIYDYMTGGTKQSDSSPEYYKWCSDCLWVHDHKDVMSIVNIFLFNKEELESISDVISFKYHKKIGVDALEIYKSVFWDCTYVTAKDALLHCVPFRKNALIVNNIRSGHGDIVDLQHEEGNDGSDVSFVFHDINYIKWKIGYKAIKVPTIKDFLEQVQTDSMYKYYEAMNMLQSVEHEEESGSNEKLGDFSSKHTRYRNVEELRVKNAQAWVNVYLKAQDAMPKGDKNTDKEFFAKMDDVVLDFEDEKIVAADSVPGLVDDVKGDM